MFISFLERERETYINVRVRRPSVASTYNLGMCNLLVYGMMLQPTEPPGQGSNFSIYPVKICLFFLFLFFYHHLRTCWLILERG